MNRTLYLKRFDMTSVCDVTEDFTLPDYIPEIRRVIGVRALATTDGKYLSGDELEADGSVTYTVLYVGGDGEIYQVSETSSYTGRAPAKSEDDRFSVSDIVLSCTAENVSCRVTAPRRITLSSRVKLSVMSQRPVSAELEAEGSVRRLTEVHRTAHIAEIRHTAETSGELRDREGSRIVMASGEICISDVRIGGGKATVKGESFVSLVLASAEGEYFTARKGAGIEEEIELPAPVEGTESRACAFAIPVMLEVESSEDGEIRWKMEYDIDLDIMESCDTEITRDAYLTDSEDIAERTEFEAYCPALSVNGRLTTSAALKQRTGMVPVCAWGVGQIDKCEIAGGRAVLTGNVKLYIPMTGGDDAVCEEVSVPLKYEAEAILGGGDFDDSALLRRASVAVNDIGIRADGESLHVTAELAISAVALGCRRIGCVKSVTPASGEEEGVTADNIIRIYVPSADEGAWDVEKRFRLKEAAQTEGECYII